LDETRSAALREKEKVRTLEQQLKDTMDDHERELGTERSRSTKQMNGQVSLLHLFMFEDSGD
jgi:hypothetical protein